MPDFKSIDQPFSNKINIDGTPYLYFGGTAYLGMPKNQDFTNLYIEGIKRFGLNNGTSRTNNIQLGIYNEVEQVAAERYGTEAALITSSGYLAAQLTVKAFAGFGRVIYAPASHPALWLVENQAKNLMPFSEWATETVKKINSSEEKNWVLVSNSMNNLIPEIYNFSFVKQVHQDKNIILIVDDSHGIGINNNGMGAIGSLPKQENIENVVVASMAKALGVDAGIVLASNKIINTLKATNTFVGASPSSPAALYAFIHAKEIYEKALNDLKSNIVMFETALNLTTRHENGFPVYLLDDLKFSERLLQNQILISSFPYPNPNDRPLDRIILSAWHEKEDIEKLIAAINF